VALEEVDGDEVTFTVKAKPVDRNQGGRLAREVLDGISTFTSGRAAPQDTRRAA
jgi:hypothetical protein